MADLTPGGLEIFPSSMMAIIPPMGNQQHPQVHARLYFNGLDRSKLDENDLVPNQGIKNRWNFMQFDSDMMYRNASLILRIGNQKFDFDKDTSKEIYNDLASKVADNLNSGKINKQKLLSLFERDTNFSKDVEKRKSAEQIDTSKNDGIMDDIINHLSEVKAGRKNLLDFIPDTADKNNHDDIRHRVTMLHSVLIHGQRDRYALSSVLDSVESKGDIKGTNAVAMFLIPRPGEQFMNTLKFRALNLGSKHWGDLIRYHYASICQENE